MQFLGSEKSSDAQFNPRQRHLLSVPKGLMKYALYILAYFSEKPVQGSKLFLWRRLLDEVHLSQLVRRSLVSPCLDAAAAAGVPLLSIRRSWET